MRRRSRLISGHFGNFVLLVPAVAGQRGNCGCVTKRSNALVQAQHWISFPHRYGSRLSVIDSEASRGVFHGHEVSWACPFCHYQFNNSGSLHAVHFGFFGFPETLIGSVRRLVHWLDSRS